jgi:hypothetical protein
MRLLFLFVAICFAAGCDDEFKDTDIVTRDKSPISITTECSRSGCSDQGVIVSSSGYRYEAPETLIVNSGNAGRGTAILSIGPNHCEYRGSSRLRRPLRSRNAVQVQRGMFYHLHHCSGSRVVELSSGESISLRVLTWDDTLPISVSAVLMVQ